MRYEVGYAYGNCKGTKTMELNHGGEGEALEKLRRSGGYPSDIRVLYVRPC